MAKSKVKSKVGEKRANARRENREARERIVAMTNQQLIGFFGGFTTEQVERLDKAMERVKKNLVSDKIKAIDKELDRLQKERDALNG